MSQAAALSRPRIFLIATGARPFATTRAPARGPAEAQTSAPGPPPPSHPRQGEADRPQLAAGPTSRARLADLTDYHTPGGARFFRAQQLRHRAHRPPPSGH